MGKTHHCNTHELLETTSSVLGLVTEKNHTRHKKGKMVELPDHSVDILQALDLILVNA